MAINDFLSLELEDTLFFGTDHQSSGDRIGQKKGDRVLGMKRRTHPSDPRSVCRDQVYSLEHVQSNM